MPKMKIAMIGQKGTPALYGGIERHVEELAVRLAQHGHKVLVFCRSWYTPLAKTEHRGVALIHTPTIRTKHLDAIIHTLTSIFTAKRLGADIYHIHGVGPALLSWLPRILDRKAKVVVTFHCIDRKHAKWNWFARMMLRLGEWMACHYATKTITVSKTLHQYCDEAYDTETTYIPNGVGDAHAGDATHLKPFGLSSNRYIAFVARLVPHKRAHDLIQAWRFLKQEKPALVEGLKLAIVGDSAFTDSYVRELRESAAGDDSIVFTGYQNGETLSALFGHALVVVNPSESEGLPIATLEAMSYGVPVIASDIAENMEVAAEYGISYPKRNVRALTDKLIWVLENPDKAKRLGERSREMVSEKFHWNDIAKTTLDLYEEISK